MVIVVLQHALDGEVKVGGVEGGNGGGISLFSCGLQCVHIIVALNKALGSFILTELP